MTKRLLAIFLALVMCFGALAGTFTAYAEEETGATEETTATETTEGTDNTEAPAEEETGMIASDDCIGILKLEEGFSAKPYWDYTQYTVGYGTQCPEDMRAYYTAYGITEEEAEVLLRNHLMKVEADLNTFMEKHGLSWTQNQFDAILLFSYNCGTGWCYSPGTTFYTAMAEGATGNDLIRAFALWCSAGNQIQSYLLRRRLSEANMYLNAIYSQTPPANYCYVLYDANGGYTSPRSQGYNSEWPVEPFPVPTHAAYTFAGWYTAKIGGTQVTKLDETTKSKTLYAHWKDSKGNDVEITETEVTVTVTGSDVNMRKGPGTNYTSIGRRAQKGEKLTIVETSAGIGYTWGRFTEYEGGWICLQYTDYDEVIENGGNADTSEPTEPTEPEPTEPEETEPTEPEPSEPEETEPVMGTVKVNQFLRVRSGPGTGYSEVARLSPDERVEILEQKVVGANIWGRIENGWISMHYVVLDSDSDNNTDTDTDTDNSGSTGNTGSTDTPVTTGKTGKIVNCSEWVRVRSGAGTTFDIAGYYYPGDVVTVTEQKTAGGITWGKTEKGWVSMDYVKLDSSTDTTTPTGQTGTIANCTDWVRIRSGAGTSYSIAGYYAPGDKVTVTEQKTAGGITWGKTEKGWVSMDYVKLDSTSGNTGNSGNSGNSGSTGSTTAPTTWTGKIVNCNDWVRIRSGAGTGYAPAGYYYPGDIIIVTEEKTSGGITWAKTDKGWVSMEFVEKVESTTKVTMTIIADYLNVRSAAGTGNTIVGYLTYGDKVEVLETTTVNGTTWGRISIGWICLDYAK